MSAYYNEHDAQKAAWLRELIRRDLIAAGEVDERSIEVVDPDELRGFTQCHFFAGIGVWSYALRNAGWADNAPVWTGSCPCPSFSQSGKGEGFDDPRHLWPAWFRLLRVCRPDVVFGEQVASDSALSWLDLVSSDLEGEGYAIGAVDLCAAGVGAPHIRQRLYFVAQSESVRRKGRQVFGRGDRAGGSAGESGQQPSSDGANRRQTNSDTNSLEHTASVGLPRRRRAASPKPSEKPSRPTQQRHGASDFWRNLIWLPCRDGKARPVEPGTFPLAHGAPARVVRLRGYGDAIVAPLAQAFIEAYQQVRSYVR